MNNAEVLSDFRRRWEGTFVWLTMDNRPDELVYLNNIEESSTKIATIHLTSDRIGKLTLNFGSEGHSLQFRYPPVGVFQHEQDAYVFYRRPSRQYRRGICADNSILFNVTRNLVGNQARWTPSKVRSAYTHETYNITTALALLEKGYKGVALDSNFSLTLSLFDGNTDYVLFHWLHPIARINSKGQVTQLLEANYKDTVNRVGFTNV